MISKTVTTSPWGGTNWEVYEYAELDSTNSEALRILNENPSIQNVVILAKKQTCGRGRSSKEWISPEGNFFCSIIIDNNYQENHLPFVTAISVGEAIDIRVVFYKWPNDLIIEDNKLCGILIEKHNNLHRYIVGIGINLIHSPTDQSCRLYDFIKIDPMELLLRVLTRLEINLCELISQGFRPLKQKWLSRAKSLNMQISTNGMIGKFRGIDDNGNLKLEKANGDLVLFCCPEV